MFLVLNDRHSIIIVHYPYQIEMEIPGNSEGFPWKILEFPRKSELHLVRVYLLVLILCSYVLYGCGCEII